MPHIPQRTLIGPLEFAGQGIHSGRPCRLKLVPAEADAGITFVRTDLPDQPQIPACLDATSQQRMLRQTILTNADLPDASVMTIEHVLAVLLGMGVTNACIEMDAAEAPIWDGSAANLARKLQEKGVRCLDGAQAPVLTIDRPLVFAPPEAEGVEYSVWPSEELILTYFLDYNHPFIGQQAATFRIQPELFAREIAPARTFCTQEEIEYLRSTGLIKGGDANNAIVIGTEGPINTELFWENELARHKMLDLLGDLCLLGCALKGHFVSLKGGHHTNALFLRFLRKEYSIQ